MGILRLHTIVAVLVLFGKVCYAQNLDSLKNLVEMTIDKKEKVDLLNTLSQKYSYISFDTSMQFAEQSYKTAIAADYTKGEIIALLQKSFYYHHIGDNKMAHDLSRQAEKLSEQIGDKILLARTYMSYGDIFANTLLFDKAFEYYSNAIDILENQDDLENYYSCLNRLGVLYGKMGKYDEAMKLFVRVKDANFENNPVGDTGVLNNIAKVNMKLGNYQSALDVYQKILQTNLEKKNYKFASSNLGNIAICYLSNFLKRQ